MTEHECIECGKRLIATYPGDPEATQMKCSTCVQGGT